MRLYRHITRVFPKIRVTLGSKPTNEEILKHGFDIKITPAIKEALNNAKELEFLTVFAEYSKDDSGQLIGLNIKVQEPQQQSGDK